MEEPVSANTPTPIGKHYKPYNELTERGKLIVEFAAMAGDPSAVGSIIVGHSNLIGSIVMSKMPYEALDIREDAVAAINARISQKIVLYAPKEGATITAWIHALARRHIASIMRTKESRMRASGRFQGITLEVEMMMDSAPLEENRVASSMAWESFLMSLSENELAWVAVIMERQERRALNCAMRSYAKKHKVDIQEVRRKAALHGLAFI